jgi:hypothetical protein
MYQTAFNPGTGPVMCSTSGRSLGGNEFGTISTTDDVAKAALEDESLLIVETEPDENSNPAFVAAYEQTEDWQEKYDGHASYDKDYLVSEAPDEYKDATKLELVTLFIERGWSLEDPDQEDEGSSADDAATGTMKSEETTKPEADSGE